MAKFSTLIRDRKAMSMVSITCAALVYSACSFTSANNHPIGSPRPEPNVEQKYYKFQPSPDAIFRPSGVTADDEGNIYIVDNELSQVLKVDTGGNASVLAGGDRKWGYRDGKGMEALFAFPSDIALDTHGDLYVTDRENSVIRKVNKSGGVSTFLGIQGGRDGQRNLPFRGIRGGDRYTAQFEYPEGIALDDGGNMYIGASSAIVKYSIDGVASIFIGSPLVPPAKQLDHCKKEVGSNVVFRGITGLAIDGEGNLLVSDLNRVFRISPSGDVLNFWGACGDHDYIDGEGGAVRFDAVWGIAVDPEGNIYVSENGRHAIRKISASGQVSTLAGSGRREDSGFVDGVGRAAKFNRPFGLFYSKRHGLLVADVGSRAIRSVSKTGVVKTIYSVTNK